MMTTRKPAAWLALLLSCLIALPAAVLADDTELFTSTANPNVLLMLDTTGSMDTPAGASAIGDLDGDGTPNTRMDILWKVVYTLLNADLSTPTHPTSTTVTVTCATIRARRWNSTTVDPAISRTRSYQWVQVGNVNDNTWSQFPSSGTVRIGSGGVSENMTYTSRSAGGGAGYYFYFSSSKSFANNYPQGSQISYTYTVAGPPALYPEDYPTDRTEALSTDFLNNLNTVDDENILKARMGLMTFSSSGAGLNIWQQVNPPPSSPNAPAFTPSYRNLWSTVTARAYAQGGTPTARALRAAQGFFNTATANNTVDICRQNFAVMVTDGEDTLGGSPSGGSGNGSSPDYYSGSGTSGTFYPDGYSTNTGQVARNNAVIQEAANLKTHSPSIKLYTVGVGISDDVPHLRVMRDVLRRAAEQGNATANDAQYRTVGASSDNTARAAGKAFFATDAAELAVSFRNIFQQITAGMYSFTAPTVASVRMTDRNYLYKASFTPATPPETFWGGHLQALTINTDNTISSPIWDADNVLRATTPDNRRIYAGYTADGVNWSRRDFTTAYIDNNLLGVDNAAVRDTVVNYVRGYNHDNNAKLGDIFHSKPVVVGPPSRFFFDDGYTTAVGPSGTQGFVDARATRKRVVYVGTNDGMLHGFLSGLYHSDTKLYDAGTGEELFGFIPYSLLDNLEGMVPGELTRHGFFVDSSPRVADVWIDGGTFDGVKQSSEWRTVLMSGLRKGGNGFFALDVTDPDASDYPGVLWEYTDPTILGQSWSEPFFGKVRVSNSSWSSSGHPIRDRWVAIFGGGKTDAGTLGSSFVVLDIATGRPLKTFTLAGGVIDNVIPAPPTAVLDANGYIKFAYVADLDGSLYKFDFRAIGTDNTYSEWGVKKIFQAPAGQPVYHRVESTSTDEFNRYLFFGTGDQEFPVSNTGTGTFYGIMDSDSFWPTTPLNETNLTNLSSYITSLGGGTVASGKSGWYIRFASVPSTAADTRTHSGEKVLSDPVVFYNTVYFTTFTANPSDPCGGGGIARVYGLNVLNAGAGLASLSALGETATSKVPYHVYAGSGEGAKGGIPSSPSLSIYPSGQSSIFIGFSTGAVEEVKIESPAQMKMIKSWKEMF